MYALNIDKETNRILSACVVLENGDYTGYEIVDRLPDKSDLPEGVTEERIDVTDFLSKDGEYVYSPLPEPEIVEEPTQLDRLEAQTYYTAMCTDTLLPEESEGEA